MSDIKNQVQKENVLKDIFSWEIPVDSVPLPSQGKIYSPNSKLFNAKTVNIKSMTAKEEDILSSQALIKEGKVIDELLKSCLIDKDIDINDLITGDKNAIMVSIRITGYGSKYDIISNCVNCNTANEVSVDLSGLEIKPLDIEPAKQGENLFKFLTGKENREIEKIEKFESEKFGSLFTKRVTNFLWFSIISINGVTDKNKIKKFVESMPAYDSASLRAYIDNYEPGVEMKHKYNCKFCDHNNNSNIPMTSNFFWPAIGN